MKLITLAVIPASIAVLSLTTSAFAQGVGGYSAGPGLAPAQEKQVDPATPAAATPAESALDQEEPYETRVITYRKSPTFTQDRQFTNARVWVLDPGRYTVEQWWTGYFGVPTGKAGQINQDDQFFQTEIEMGVAKHIQVDIYLNYEFNQQGDGNYAVASGGHTGVAAEVRIAIPDYWGQVWGNPTLYFEVLSQYYNAPRAEARLLLGGTMFTPKLLGAVNFEFERNIFRDNLSGIDYEIKSLWGANYEIIDNWLRIGAQATFGWDSHGCINADGTTCLHEVAQVGPQLLFTVPSRFFKVLASVMFGFADYDAPVSPQVVASCTF